MKGLLIYYTILNEAKPLLKRLVEGRDKNKVIFDHYNRCYFQDLVSRTVGEVFPDKYITFHSLRKSFAMYLINILRLHPKEVHDMMRHASMETTMAFYTEVEVDRLDLAINKRGAAHGKYVVQNVEPNSIVNDNSFRNNRLRLVK